MVHFRPDSIQYHHSIKPAFYYYFEKPMNKRVKTLLNR